MRLHLSSGSCLRCLLALPLLAALTSAAHAASNVVAGDTITGTFTGPVYAGNVLNYPTLGASTFYDNTGSAVTGTATAGGSGCGGNTLCWGASTSGVPLPQSYSALTFTGSSTFNPAVSNQVLGTISFLNGTSDLDSLIFGATLNLYDNGNFVGSDNVIITTTSNQYSGTGLSPSQLATDADYINICGNNSNICTSSIEAYEDSEGGTGLLVDLSGTLVGDPTLVLTNVNLDPTQSSCTTCGTVGTEPALGAAAPEPGTLVTLSTGLTLMLPAARYTFRRSRR